ncbi:Helix-turn-helix domain-containing protein [Rhizobium lusitanum]|jgi:transcriptional regulator with XRE-family HTH domain|uniref:Helix-turn-helix domain-containing protein n=2 Tax=Rhizobium/Agrobacterium group TaxID=227290 RepID=A0A1C3XLP2_9HYPH|nr:helix-turn-helix transcriptional regulator [Rhizobium lusitanum]SCB53183.1 Helix-turn-helix domain-containing protein [Rhizobium lusitanum]
MLNADQIRMARAALRWGVRDLASRANITAATVTRIEAGRPGYAATLEAIQVAFEAAGIEFIPENGGGVGVRFSKPRD